MNLLIERNIPFRKKNSDLVNALMGLKNGESTYLSYTEFTKTDIGNCIASARIRMGERKMVLRTLADEGGRRVWAYDLAFYNEHSYLFK